MEQEMTYTSRAVVTEQQTARQMGSGDLPVLATPALVALMENAAMMCARGILQEGDTTVGGSIEVKHLAPSPVGANITATATMTAQSGKKLTFAITASDDQREIGTATHTRFIVNSEKFMQGIGK